MAGLRFHKKARGEHGHRRPLVRTTVLFLAFAGVAAGAIPPATVPPSSYQNGLVERPNPIDPSGNLAITGNVLGGKHFRGTIPYNSTTSFRAPLGTTRLDSFLRYSGVPQTQPGYPQSYSPFYSSTGTVTTTVPGYQGVFAPTSPRIAGGLPQLRADQPADVMPMAGLQEPQISSGQRSAAIDSSISTPPQLRYQPMFQSPERMGEIAPAEPGDSFAGRLPTQAGERLMTPEEVQRRLEELRRNVDRIESDMSRLRQTPDGDNVANSAEPPLQPPLHQSPPAELRQNNESLLEGLRTLPPTSPRLELYDPAAHREQVLATPPALVGQTGAPIPSPLQPEAVPSGRVPALQRIEETTRAFDASSKLLNRPANEPAATSDSPRNAAAQGIPVPDRNEAQPSSGQSSATRQTYEDAGSIAQKQFDHYLTAAAGYMQQGRYDRAANSFTLALAYIPHDPRAHLGKSHALLATGEYVAAAASLEKAIELDAQYVLRQVDLVETVGGPDRFIQRITELEEQAESNDASELQLLLAYIYHQMNLPDRAKTAIETARRGLPSSVAANLLEAALQQGRRSR